MKRCIGPRARPFLPWLGGGLAALVLPLALGAAESAGVQITDVGGKLRIQLDGQLFAEYRYQDVSRPFLYPIIGPTGQPMTRHWPMESGEGEEHDHPHHRSLWWAHGAVNGHDFWSEGAKAGKTVQEKLTEVISGPDQGLIKSQCQMVARDGTVVATEECCLRVYHRKADRMLDFEVTVRASQGELVFGDTKEGTMAIRLAETMRLTHGKTAGQGHIVNSDGMRDGATWGKRAKWCDYYGPVNGETVGVAIFDHPSNPRHPTWWHVRDYGLFAANPFGAHDFERQPAGAGDLRLEAGKSLTFRYRFYFHRGDEQQGRVAERYAEFVAGQPPK